jgi:tetratricopeptide (TPR) repeat protein
VGGEFVLTTSQFGPNLYIGNHAGATGVLAPLRAGRDGPRYERIDATELAEAATGRNLSPSEVSRYWVRRVVDFITTQPLAWARLLCVKAALLVNAHEVADAEDIYYYEKHSPLLLALLRVNHLGVLLPVAAIGLVFSVRHARRLWLLYGLLIAFAVGVVIFFVFARYRYPVVPPLIVFAAFGIVRLATAARAREWRRFGIAALAALPAAVAANWPLRPRTEYLATAYSNAAAALTEHGRAAEALVELQHGLRLAPDRADLHLNRGVIYVRLNQLAEAVSAFRRADELRPGDPLIEFHLGVALAESGDLQGAAVKLESAWRRAPEDEMTARNFIAVLRMLQRYPQLAAVLRRRHEAAPHDRARAAELAWLLATCSDAAVRDGPAAARLAAAALAPGDAQSLDILAAALAESGAYEEAVRTAEQALVRAREQGAAADAAGIAARLDLYRARQPYRE